MKQDIASQAMQCQVSHGNSNLIKHPPTVIPAKAGIQLSNVAKRLIHAT